MDIGNTKHYIAERYCVLCRKQLPFFTYVSLLLDKFVSWEKEVLGFVNVNLDKRLDPQVFAFKANLDDSDFITNPNFTLTNGQGGKRTVVICCKRQHTYASAFFVHLCCWKLTRTLEPKLSCLDLYNLGVQLSEIIPRGCWKNSEPWHLASFSNCSAIGDTKLGRWLSKCAQLPMEMQYQILSQVDEDKLAFSLLATLQTHSLSGIYSSALLPYPNSIRSLIPDFDTDVVHLCASFVNLFGQNYLYRVGIFDTSVRHGTWNHQHIEVKIHTICKVEFLVGIIGITGVKFYFRDGSISPWLGSDRVGWRCGPLDVNLSDIKLLKKDHKEVLRHFSHFVDRHLGDCMRSKALPIRAFWMSSRYMYRSGESFIAPMYKKQLPEMLRSFPGQMMCRYLPLRQDGCHVKGMTVYTSYYGTSSITLHGRSSDVMVVSVPGRRGSPTSFYFKEGEEILTIGLVVVAFYDAQFGPYLMFKTNRGRLAYFGPPSLLFDTSTRYMPLIPDRLKQKCFVMGLIVDQMSVINDSFKTIGVHCHPRKNAATTETITSSPERQIYIHPLPEKLRLFPFNSGASKTMARLYNIKQLRVQKKPANDEDPQAGLRYSGLWIYHTDESIDTLGPWNGSSTVPSDLIYDSETDGHLLRLIFRLTRGGKWKDRSNIAYYMSSIVAKSVHGRDVEEPLEPLQLQEPQESQEPQEPQEPQELQQPQQSQQPQGFQQPQELPDINEEPAEKILDWEISQSKPPIAWCFTEWVDHVEACSTTSGIVRLKEYDNPSQLRQVV